MKNIDIVLKNIDKEPVNLANEYYTLLKDEQFNKLVNSLDVDTKELIKYQSKLNNTATMLKKCSQCSSLLSCQSEVEGYIYYPTIFNNQLTFSYISCKHKKIFNEENNYQKNIKLYNMPSGLSDATLANIWVKDKQRIPIIKKMTAFIDEYLETKKGKGIYLCGSFGSGKTYLLSALLNQLATKNIKVAAIYYPEFLRSLKASFESGGYNSKFNYIQNVPILLLDDIGAETTTAWSRDEILGSILQHRMVNELPTFFTSNFTIDELDQHLSLTKSGTDEIKSRRIIERIRFLSEEVKLISINNRSSQNKNI